MSPVSNTQQCPALNPLSTTLHLRIEVAPPDNPSRHDFKGQHLCDPCWNGQHYHRKAGANGKAKGGIIIDCLAGECECPCRMLLAEQGRKISEQPKKPQPINTNQLALFKVA